MLEISAQKTWMVSLHMSFRSVLSVNEISLIIYNSCVRLSKIPKAVST